MKRSERIVTAIIAAGAVPGGPAFSTERAEERDPRPPYSTNIEQEARRNTAYRRVLETGEKSQLVVMSIPPGGEIGEERHETVEQTFVAVSGRGEVLLEGERRPFAPGDIVVVPPGTRHNFVNVGAAPLKLYTLYAPPNHLDGRVQRTKTDAERDEADQAFGESVD
jgi:mannose-6-phosphate isomerase-like protein (cupin superfamily)